MTFRRATHPGGSDRDPIRRLRRRQHGVLEHVWSPPTPTRPTTGWQRFRDDPDHLSDVVRFDQPRLGDIAGLRGVHLQCHIGTDTVSLARLGAQMTGLDLSAPAFEVAAGWRVDAGVDVTFVEAHTYDALTCSSPASFDLVYTGIGALNWLPTSATGRRWWPACSRRAVGCSSARDIRCSCALAEARPDGLLAVEYPYFETAGRGVRRCRHVCRDRPGPRFRLDDRVQPRTRRDHDRARRRRDGDHRRSRSTTRFRGSRSRVRWTRSAAASTASPIAPSGCRTATRCRPARPRRMRGVDGPSFARCETSAMSDRVLVTIADGIADVRFNRPDKRNALDAEQFAAIAEAGERLMTEPGLRVVVLSGEGESFCAGLDFSIFGEMAGGEGTGAADRTAATRAHAHERGITHLAQQICWVWQELPVPVIAAVHGHALGGGLQIALGRRHPDRPPRHQAVGARAALGHHPRHDRHVHAEPAGAQRRRPRADVHGTGVRRPRGLRARARHAAQRARRTTTRWRSRRQIAGAQPATVSAAPRRCSTACSPTAPPSSSPRSDV